MSGAAARRWSAPPTPPATPRPTPRVTPRDEESALLASLPPATRRPIRLEAAVAELVHLAGALLTSEAREYRGVADALERLADRLREAAR